MDLDLVFVATLALPFAGEPTLMNTFAPVRVQPAIRSLPATLRPACQSPGKMVLLTDVAWNFPSRDWTFYLRW